MSYLDGVLICYSILATIAAISAFLQLSKSIDDNQQLDQIIDTYQYDLHRFQDKYYDLKKKIANLIGDEDA